MSKHSEAQRQIDRDRQIDAEVVKRMEAERRAVQERIARETGRKF